ncbi:MAG: hypothetical protein AAF360_04695 [Pseudomonadota bacterium]
MLKQTRYRETCFYAPTLAPQTSVKASPAPKSPSACSVIITAKTVIEGCATIVSATVSYLLARLAVYLVRQGRMYDAGVNRQKDQLGVYAVAGRYRFIKTSLSSLRAGKGIAGDELIRTKNGKAQQFRSFLIVCVTKDVVRIRRFLQEPYRRELHRFGNHTRVYVELTQSLIQRFQAFGAAKEIK